VQRLAALDFALVQRWWPAWWLRWLARREIPEVLANVTLFYSQARQSFTERNQRVKLGRIAASEERDLTFSRQVQHEKRKSLGTGRVDVDAAGRTGSPAPGLPD
jgi:hypothetical protein